MNTGTFSMIIFALIIIIGGYLIMTESVEGRAKLILIVVISILTIFLILNLGLFSSSNKILDSPVTAISVIDPLKKYNYVANYSLSTWIYVNDWNKYNGEEKNILVRTLGGKSNPRLYLDPYENQLNIEYAIDPKNEQDTVRTDTITIPNINTQKWVNITCCFSNTNIDTYINGKLVDTTIPENKLYYPTIEVGNAQLDIKVCPDLKGFSGFISNTYYYPKILTPQDAWNIYKKGFSNNMLGNLLNKYNAKFTFYDNQNEVAKFYIM
jgi:hypothetical protein